MKSTIDLLLLRTKLKLTQAQLAEKVGVSQMTVWRWENFGLPKRGAARKLIERIVAEAA